MGRRSLRPIRSDVDAATRLLSFESLPSPLTTDALFGRQAPWEVEVGSGKGLFLQNATQRRPEHVFLGIELARRYAHHAAARLAQHGRDNGLVLQGDALRLFAEHLGDEQLEAVHVYFPDPWWKKRHRRRRVMCPPFLENIRRTLRPGGKLHFWTDVQEYFESSLELLEAIDLEGPQPVAESPAEHDLDYRTHFERRTRLQDQPVYRAEYVKPLSCPRRTC